MDIWFKAKVDWGEALSLLSDTEAGRFAKALWKYAATGEAGTLTGREQMLFALVLADLRREAEHRERISALRSEAGRRGGRPRAESKTSNGLSPKADESNQSETESRKEKDRTQTKEPEAGCAEGGGAAVSRSGDQEFSSARNLRESRKTMTLRGGRVMVSSVLGLRPLREALS